MSLLPLWSFVACSRLNVTLQEVLEEKHEKRYLRCLTTDLLNPYKGVTDWTVVFGDIRVLRTEEHLVNTEFGSKWSY
jgi:hypothetical protein